jgi:hypothetical protein
MPNSYNVANEIDRKYIEFKRHFATEELPVAVKAGFACTVDFSQSGPDYTAITMHYIDNDW